MLPTGMSPMNSQNLMLSGFQGQVPVSPGQQGQISMMPRPRAPVRVASTASATGVTSAPFPGGYYQSMYY